MITVRKGWVRVVYEDQGEPFVMTEGDLVLQPPEIRHRVLESSEGAEVVEISCPALHETVADHDMILPTGRIDALRDFGGQHFLRHVAADTPWTAWHAAEKQETAMGEATRGLAEARVLRPGAARTIAAPPHDGELEFGFLIEGSARLDYGEGYALGPGDAFVIPPGKLWGLRDASSDLRLLHVTTGKSA
jgi:quercetin dioxygenase-like cupin family protein